MPKKKTDEPVAEETTDETEEEVEAPDPKLAEFAEEWFARHADEGVADVGFQAGHCDCGEDACTGFQMVHPHDHAHHYH